MKLPQWKAAESRTKLGVADVLDTFVYEHEPANSTEAILWRRLLEDVLVCVQTGGCKGEVEDDVDGCAPMQFEFDIEQTTNVN